MSTIRAYNQQNISADTGEVVALAAPAPGNGFPFPVGTGEDIVTFRMRVRCNTPQDPYAGAQMLVTVRWNDGQVDQAWNVAVPCDSVDTYVEAGQEIWMDWSRDCTIQVQPLVSGGSVDVLLDYVER